MRKRISTGIWLTVALLALGFLAYQTRRGDAFDDFRQALGGVDWIWVVMAVLVQLVAQTLLATRWQVLLWAQAIRIRWFQAVKLTYLGLFYNNVMPGGVGGDLLKAWYITHHSEHSQRLAAAVTVFVDRLLGLVGTIMMASVASLFVGKEIAYRQVQIRWVVWSIFALLLLAATVFLSRRVRRGLLLSWFLKKLPFAGKLQKIDASMQIYRQHGRKMLFCLMLTGVLQGLTIMAIWMLTKALHLENVKLVHCLAIMPLVWLIGAAIPVPGGLGIIENCVKYLFCLVINRNDPSSAVGAATALAVLNRVVVLYFCSLPGALVPLFGGHLPKRSEIEREMDQPLEQGNQ